MTVVVDANIIVSAILNYQGKIGELLLKGNPSFFFIAPEFLQHELSTQYSKLAAYLGISLREVKETERYVTRNITFLSEKSISESIRQSSLLPVSSIDKKDAIYVAFAEYHDGLLWSGGKKLIKGLRRKKYQKILTTDDLYRMWGQ